LTTETIMNTISSFENPKRKDKITMTSNNAGTARYSNVNETKLSGATYTPKLLADFVARKLVAAYGEFPSNRPIRILDPGVGDGALLVSLLEQFKDQSKVKIEIHGFETNPTALNTSSKLLRDSFPKYELVLKGEDFLSFVLQHFGMQSNRSLFDPPIPEKYDLIIANPPYVRTQIMGGVKAQHLAKQFGLSGRVDLYHAFLLAMAQVLKPCGYAGIIVSNRFMTTKTGATVRQVLLEQYNLLHVWDLGDTKLFKAAVLPAVLLAQGKNKTIPEKPCFTSIYETKKQAICNENYDPITALSFDGVVKTTDGRHFLVQQGRLDTSGSIAGVWRNATTNTNKWLAEVKTHTWGTFRDIGKIRVGVKTCADKVFIRSDWHDMSEEDRPELLKPLTTHHIARRFISLASEHQKQILYPHEVVQGHRTAISLDDYPRSYAYLSSHRTALEKRKYVTQAGRKWYEIWVPQDPDAWKLPKLVFRDIAQEPTFWIDLEGTVVNGDCYWLVADTPKTEELIWLAVAVGNSTFIEQFYDYRFNNKLYAGRRRYITQYVEKFPLPDPNSRISRNIMARAKQLHQLIPSTETCAIEEELDSMVWRAFGLSIKEVSR